MSPSLDLPPPPAHPELPPEVRIAGEEELSFVTDDGVTIEALANLPASATRVVVLCHPHPLYGGTMHNAIVVVVAKRLLERGQGRVGWVRLNFRGVGKSGGTYGRGEDEIRDVRAAFEEVRRRLSGAKQSVVGYSFGSGAGYVAATLDGRVENAVLIAPSPRVMREPLGDFIGPVLLIAAGRDQLCTAEETADLVRRLGASVRVLEEADHYFIRFRREVAGLVVSFIAPELSP